VQYRLKKILASSAAKTSRLSS